MSAYNNSAFYVMNDFYLRGNILKFFKDPAEPNMDFGLAYAESNEQDQVIYNQLCKGEEIDVAFQQLETAYEAYIEEGGTMPYYKYAIAYPKVCRHMLRMFRRRFPNAVGVQLVIPPSMFM